MPLPIDIRVSLLDGNGNTSKQVAHIAAATTLANAFLYAQDLAEILDALSDAKVIGAEVLAPVDLSGQDIKTDPTVQSDIESGAKFVFRDAYGLLYTSRIPAIVASCLVPNSKLVDLQNAGVQAYVNGIIGVLGGDPGVNSLTKASTDIETLFSARQSFRRNLKGRRR